MLPLTKLLDVKQTPPLIILYYPASCENISLDVQRTDDWTKFAKTYIVPLSQTVHYDRGIAVTPTVGGYDERHLLRCWCCSGGVAVTTMTVGGYDKRQSLQSWHCSDIVTVSGYVELMMMSSKNKLKSHQHITMSRFTLTYIHSKLHQFL